MKRRAHLGQVTNGSRQGSVADKHRNSKTTNFDTLINSNNGNKSTDDWRVCAIIAIVSIVVYINGLPGDFVHDDIPAITMNKDVLGLNPITNVFSNDFWGTPMADINSHKSYRPLTILSFRINYLMFGLRPIWFHATNIVLHATACILFTKVCVVIAKLRKNFATIAGILFAVHPIHTEAVTGIVGRADVLACIFFLISLLIYHGNKDELDGAAIWFSIILGGLSMLAKETGVTVLLLNLFYDTYRCWPSLKRTIVDVRWSEETNLFVRRISRVLLSMCVLLAIRLALLQGSLPRFSQQDNPTAFHPNVYVRLLTFCYLAAFNWWLCICPATLSHDWQMGSIPLLATVSDPRNLLTFIVFSAAILLAYRGVIDFEQQRHVPLVLGFLLLILPFLPATNLVVTVGFVVAERVLYIPSLGCVLLVVYGAQVLWEAFPKYRSLITLMGIVVIAGGTLTTVKRNHDWYSRETLLRAGLAVLPHNAKMHYNFGNFLRDSSKPDIAINHYRQALKLWPTYASAHNNLGTLINAVELAEHHFLEAIKYSSDHVNAHYNLGQLYRKANRTTEAIYMLERCIKLEPLFIPAYLKLYKLRSGVRAGRILRKVAEISSTCPEHITHYGNWLLENNLLHDAKKEFQKALRVAKFHQQALIGACRILRKIGQHSRLLQIVLRWQSMIRKGNGAKSKQPDIYLREWSIKHELRNRAMVYDTSSIFGHNGSRSTILSGFQSSTFNRSDPIKKYKLNISNNSKNHKLDANINLTIAETNYNIYEHSYSLIECPSSQSHNTTDSTSLKSVKTNMGNTNCRKWWPKIKYKRKKNNLNVEPNESVAPLLVSNLLDKL